VLEPSTLERRPARRFSKPLVLAFLLATALAASVSLARRDASGERYWLSSTPRWPPSGGSAGYALTLLPTAQGVVLQGAVRPSPQSPARFILFFPGNSPDQLEGSIPLLERLRFGLPLGAAVWSYRSAGASTGTPSPEAGAVDARAQARYLQRHYGVTPAHLLLVGYSLGTGSALRLAADLTRANTPPGALLLMSPFRTLRVQRSEWYGPWMAEDLYANEALVNAVRCPVLIVAGDRDTALPIDLHARPLARSFGVRARYLELSGKGHLDYLTDATSMHALTAFLAAHTYSP
jgi:pimeloyl-ACP methyl ester carboxylesterase